MRNLLFAILLFSPGMLSSQSEREEISFELRYPALVNGITFYSGVVDVGVDYRVMTKDKLGLGLGLNVGQFERNVSSKLRVVTPKINLDYNLEWGVLEVDPQVSIGFSFMRFLDEDEILSGNGLNLTGGIKLIYKTDRKLNIFAQFTHEYTKLKRDTEYGNGQYSRDIFIFYPGIGVRYKVI